MCFTHTRLPYYAPLLSSTIYQMYCLKIQNNFFWSPKRETKGIFKCWKSIFKYSQIRQKCVYLHFIQGVTNQTSEIGKCSCQNDKYLAVNFLGNILHRLSRKDMSSHIWYPMHFFLVALPPLCQICHLCVTCPCFFLFKLLALWEMSCRIIIEILQNKLAN